MSYAIEKEVNRALGRYVKGSKFRTYKVEGGAFRMKSGIYDEHGKHKVNKNEAVPDAATMYAMMRDTVKRGYTRQTSMEVPTPEREATLADWAIGKDEEAEVEPII